MRVHRQKMIMVKYIAMRMRRYVRRFGQNMEVRDRRAHRQVLMSVMPGVKPACEEQASGIMLKFITRMLRNW